LVTEIFVTLLKYCRNVGIEHKYIAFANTVKAKQSISNLPNRENVSVNGDINPSIPCFFVRWW
jgi:hypothetical protein